MKKQIPVLPGTWQSISKSLILLAVVLTVSCNSPDTEPVNSYNYYPLQSGDYRIYDVTEDTYSVGQKNPVNKTWKEKDEIIRDDKSTNSGKRYIVARSIWDKQSELWVKTKEYVITSFPDKIMINLDNEIFTPLLFPCSYGLQWDGYEYFNLDLNDPRFATLHHYEAINEPLTLNSLNFERTIKVSERRDTTGVGRYRLGFKYYASGIGLVADEQTDFEYLQENGAFVGDRTIGSGKRTIKRIVDYGVAK